MKKTTHGASSKFVLIFGFVFTGLITITLLYQWANPSGGWLRGINSAWVNFRLNSPAYLAVVFKDEAGAYDYSFGKLINKPGDPRIIIAAIDSHTLNSLGYPFPRKYYGKMIENLNKLGVKSIVMDVFTVDPDRAGPESELAYVQAVAKAGNVSSIIDWDRNNKKYQLPIKGLDLASKYIAIPNMDKTVGQSDNVVRKVYLFDPDSTYSDVPGLKIKCPKTECGPLGLAGLAAVSYASYNGLPLNDVYHIFGGEPLSLNFRFPKIRKAHPGWDNDPSTTYSLYEHISVKDILDGKLSKEQKASLKGAAILVGATAIGAYDHYPSAFQANMPGVEIHANALDNMLNGDFLNPINGLLFSLLVIGSIWLPIWVRKYSISVISAAVGSVFVVLFLLDIFLLYKEYDFAFGYFVVCMGLPFVFVTVHKALAEGQEKKWIKNTFGQYLSPKVVDIITKDPSKLSLGGEKRDMTAFFLDLAGFTTMSEKMTPEELTTMLNDYLSAFTEIILKHDGTVDKYIGDCIVAFWNAPLDQTEHKKLALLAAVDCQVEMARLNEALTQYTIKPAARVGVNSGPMVVGNMGSKTRLSYTVMGDAVNLSSRLEGANKFFHSKIMTSEATFGELKDVFDHRYLGSIRVVGKAIPVRVYEPFARKGEAAPEVKAMLKRYEAGLEKFYKGDYAGSLPEFQAALAARPNDGPSQFYIETAEQYIKEPPKDWDQSFNLTSKG